MFERVTQEARRVIFFARYEASRFGSPRIDSEHILLGLCREDPVVVNHALHEIGKASDLRSSIERNIEPRERIATSVEVPLSDDAKRILFSAAKEAERLNHEHIGTEHFVLGILATPKSTAGRILAELGVTLDDFRALVAGGAVSKREVEEREVEQATTALNAFLVGIGRTEWADFAPNFAEQALFVDSQAKFWQGREKIGKQFDTLLAPYGAEGVTFLVETVRSVSGDLYIGKVLWKDVIVAGGTSKSTLRMTIYLEGRQGDWVVCSVHVTPIHAA